MVVFRTSTIENLTELFGLAGGMRAAARMIREADGILLDVPHESAEFVARTLGKPVSDPTDQDVIDLTRLQSKRTPSQG